VDVLIVNAGSSSLKLRVLGAGNTVVASADLPAPRDASDTAELEDTLARFGRVDAACVSKTPRLPRRVFLDQRASKAYGLRPNDHNQSGQMTTEVMSR
jgi:hypothetical protein